MQKTIIAVALAALLLLAAWAGRKVFPPPQHGPVATEPLALPEGFVDSSSYVSASLAGEGADAVVTLHAADGWHVNANPVSLEGLIPATVWLAQGDVRQPAQASYPPGQSSGIIIDDTDILVYEDGTRIALTGLDAAAGQEVQVHVQACSSEGICLVPATVIAERAG